MRIDPDIQGTAQAYDDLERQMLVFVEGFYRSDKVESEIQLEGVSADLAIEALRAAKESFMRQARTASFAGVQLEVKKKPEVPGGVLIVRKLQR